MDKEAFLKLGTGRNIIDSQNVLEALNQIIENKSLKEYPNIEKWINNNIKNYFMQKAPIEEMKDISVLSKAIQEIIKEKKINSPYHKIIIKSELIDSINHIIDYLKSEFGKEKDLSRISYEQSKINADVWLTNRLKKLTEEEDPEFVIPVMKFEYEKEHYQWVNLRSHKALRRESFMMNHCIETYWEESFKDIINVQEETPFYSLRDTQNTPLVTLQSFLIEKDGEIKRVVNEIKEKNNQSLSHKNREFTDLLFESMDFSKGNNIYFDLYERENSQYYHLDDNDNKFYSINKIIKNKIKKAQVGYIEIDSLIDYFSYEEILSLFVFIKIDIQEKFAELLMHAYQINIENINNKNLQVHAQDIIIKNSNNLVVNISLYKQNSNETNRELLQYSYKTTLYFENVHGSTINLNNINVTNCVFIFKNCSNLNIIHAHDNISYDEKRIALIDSEEINIPICRATTIMSLKKNQEKIEWKRGGNQENLNYRHYLNASQAIFEAYFKKLKETNKDSDELLLNLINQMQVNFISDINSATSSQLSLNKYKVLTNHTKALVDLLRNPIKMIEELSETIDLSVLVKDMIRFTKKNGILLLNNNNINKFADMKSVLEKYIKNVNVALEKTRPLLEKLLKNNDDNGFTDYLINFENNVIREEFNLLSTSNINNFRQDYWVTTLQIYMFKNEVLNIILKDNNPESNIAYRFSFKEERMRDFSAKRWAKFLSPGYKRTFTKECTEILSSPFDNNMLLLPLENKEEIISKRLKIK